MKEILEIEEDTFRMRIEQAKKNKTPEFTMKELETVLKSLKNGKARTLMNIFVSY